MTKKILNKNPLWFLFLAIVFVVLHNAFYAIFKFEEPIFFFLTFISFFIFLASIIYRAVNFLKNRYKFGVK